MHNALKLLALTALALVLAGCALRLTYGQLDWLTLRWINQQVSLSGEQDRAARRWLDDKLAWHCANELPAYAELLTQLRADIAANRISVERLSVHGERIAEFGRRLIEHSQPEIIALMASLDQDQVIELLSGFDERNAEWLEEIEDQSPEEARTERVRAFERGMRRFTGSRLTPEQRSRLEVWAAALEPTAELELASRMAWQQNLADALSRRDRNGEFEAMMTELLTPGAGWTDEYRRRMEANRQLTLNTLVDLHHMAPPRQLQRLDSRLGSFIRDIERLSCRA